MARAINCKKCLHEKVCALWTRQESQDASCFCQDGCDYFAPTLTLPNEPLTCEGCAEDGKWEWEYQNGAECPCTYCKRRAADCYRRPPEGEA